MKPPAKGCMYLMTDAFFGPVYCAATATALREDVWYCGRHDPVRVAARDAARAARVAARGIARLEQQARHMQRRRDIAMIVRAVAAHVCCCSETCGCGCCVPDAGLGALARGIVAEWDERRRSDERR